MVTFFQKNWFSRVLLVLLILVSWVLVAHAVGEFLDRIVRVEMKNEKARKSLMLRRPRHEVFDEAGKRKEFRVQMLKCFGLLLLLLTCSCIVAQTMVLDEPDWYDWTEPLYFSVVTLATIGYGDVTPKSERSRLAIGLLALFGVPLFGMVLGRIVQITYGQARLQSLPQVSGGLSNETFDQLIDFTDQMWRANAYNSKPQLSRREQITPFEFLFHAHEEPICLTGRNPSHHEQLFRVGHHSEWSPGATGCRRMGLPGLQGASGLPQPAEPQVPQKFAAQWCELEGKL